MRSLAAAASTVALCCAVLVGTSPQRALADDEPGGLGSEVVPTGETPSPPASGFAGNDAIKPPIATESPSFGQIADKAGIQLRTYRYSSLYGNASTLDVYTPRALAGRHARPVGTVVLVHGGAWQKGDRIDLEAKAVRLAKLGLVAVSVNYRLATEAAWPAQRDDVDAAVNYVRQNARYFNVDKKRIVLLGSSAGGQIAAAVATAGAGSERFRGLVTLSGLLDPRWMANTDPDYSNAVIPEKLLRCLPADCPELYSSATAADSLDATDMSSLLFHSEFEEPWGPEQAQDFVLASQAAGVQADLVTLQGSLHGIDTWFEIWPTLRGWLLYQIGATED
jgi:acetyl esterase/lipase